MVYIKMSTPIRDFDKIRIKEFHIFEPNGNEGTSIGLKYSVYKDTGIEVTECYEKFLSITDVDFISTIKNYKSPNLSNYDSICKLLFEHLIAKGIELGTIEVK